MRTKLRLIFFQSIPLADLSNISSHLLYRRILNHQHLKAVAVAVVVAVDVVLRFRRKVFRCLLKFLEFFEDNFLLLVSFLFLSKDSSLLMIE